jgi:D-sedoheptulose 7-phosphate isomerase
MLESRLQQSFFDCADLLYQAAEPLARPLSEAAEAVIGCLTAGGKLLVTGGPLAGHAAALLVRGFERERPPLAALAIASEPTPLRALGQPGDLLLLLDDGLTPAATLELLEAAHDQDMAVIALAGAAPTWRGALTEADVLVAVPHERSARVRELQLVMLHALAEAIDFQLLGEQDPA